MLTNSPTQPFNDSNRKASLPTESDVWHSCQVLAIQKNLRPTHHVLLRNISHNGMQQTDPGRRALGRFQAGLFVHRHQSQNHCVVPAPPASFPRIPRVPPPLWDPPDCAGSVPCPLLQRSEGTGSFLVLFCFPPP